MQGAKVHTIVLFGELLLASLLGRMVTVVTGPFFKVWNETHPQSFKNFLHIFWWNKTRQTYLNRNQNFDPRHLFNTRQLLYLSKILAVLTLLKDRMYVSILVIINLDKVILWKTIDFAAYPEKPEDHKIKIPEKQRVHYFWSMIRYEA